MNATECKKSLPVAALLMATMTTATVSAASSIPPASEEPLNTTSFYAYGNIGKANKNLSVIDNRSMTDLFSPMSGNGNHFADTRSSSWNVGIGAQLNHWLSVEGGYVNLGSHQDGANFLPSDGSYVGFRATTKTQGWSTHLVGSYPIDSRFELIGKIGANYLITSTTLGAVQRPIGEQATQYGAYARNRQLVPSIGGGAAWKVSEKVTLRAEYERFGSIKSNARLGNGDLGFRSPVDLFTAGVKMAF